VVVSASTVADFRFFHFGPLSHFLKQAGTIQKQGEKIAEPESRIEDLEAQLKQNCRNRSRSPSGDLTNQTPESEEKEWKQPGGQKNHNGKILAMAEDPDEII